MRTLKTFCCLLITMLMLSLSGCGGHSMYGSSPSYSTTTSDQAITDSIRAKLAADDLTKAYKVDIQTSDGVVVLRGTVTNPQIKRRAQAIAKNEPGVRSVVNEIVLK